MKTHRAKSTTSGTDGDAPHQCAKNTSRKLDHFRCTRRRRQHHGMHLAAQNTSCLLEGVRVPPSREMIGQLSPVKALDFLYYCDTCHIIGPGSNPDRGMKCRLEKYQLKKTATYNLRSLIQNFSLASATCDLVIKLLSDFYHLRVLFIS